MTVPARVAVLVATMFAAVLLAVPAFAEPGPIAATQAAAAIPFQPDRFETLAAAIAAQDAAVVDEATSCLASAIYFEAKGEPVDGQLAVAEVVINRARSGRFPADLCDVVRQRGQFSFVHGGVIPAVNAAGALYRTALAVAKVAMVKAWESSAPRALYFHARRVAASARWVRVAAIGNHIFYR